MEELFETLKLEDICELCDFGFTNEPCERQIGDPEDEANTIVKCAPIPGLEKEYSEFWVDFTANEFYGIPINSGSRPILIPRDKWMKPDEYARWRNFAAD